MQCSAMAHNRNGTTQCPFEARYSICDSAPDPLWTYACQYHVGHETDWMAMDNLPITVNLIPAD